MEIKTFLNKPKLRELITYRSVLKAAQKEFQEGKLSQMST